MYYHNFNRGVPFLPTTPSHYDTGASKENFGKCLSHGYYDMALSGFDPTTSVTTSNPIIFKINYQSRYQRALQLVVYNFKKKASNLIEK